MATFIERENEKQMRSGSDFAISSTRTGTSNCLSFGTASPCASRTVFQKAIAKKENKASDRKEMYEIKGKKKAER